MYLLLLLLIFSTNVAAQNKPTYSSVDSISYVQYLHGQWDELIQTGKEALAENIDFKRLRQRMGYAYFAKKNYYSSQYHYEKALSYDSSDPDTRLYLYYCGLNIGNTINARYHASYLSTETKNKLDIKSIQIIDAIDLEYNFKTNNDSTRSNPSYKRIGLNSQLGYRINVYQAVSKYDQSFSTFGYNYNTNQLEYYGALNVALNAHTNMDIAYHYVFTNLDQIIYTGNVFLGKLQTSIQRFNIGLIASNYRCSSDTSIQIGLQGGVSLPGKRTFTLSGTIYNIHNNTGNRIVFSQTAGIFLLKNMWAEGNLTLGNLKNYVDKNGLYVYNSLDPTTFRTGVSLFWYTGKKITLFGNYTMDKKTNIDTNNIYNQHSISGGLIWKF